ncbi:hypothetical protein ACNKHQ_17705 [Shigella flexneri]
MKRICFYVASKTLLQSINDEDDADAPGDDLNRASGVGMHFADWATMTASGCADRRSPPRL